MHWSNPARTRTFGDMTTTYTSRLDPSVLSGMHRAARTSGERLLASFPFRPAPLTLDEVYAAVAHNEAVSEAGLRDALVALRPGAGWAEDDQDPTTLLDGEWWVVDSVEGNINHLHGTDDWGVSITLLREGAPAATVFRQPSVDRTYSALAGAGAFLDGQRLTVSRTPHLAAALVATGQAEPGQTRTYRPIADSVAAMLETALLVQVSVPSTFPLARVASGQIDAFWQYDPVLPGIASGILLALEAGGAVSTLDGGPWTPGAPDVLVSNGLVHPEAVTALSSLPSPLHP